MSVLGIPELKQGAGLQRENERLQMAADGMSMCEACGSPENVLQGQKRKLSGGHVARRTNADKLPAGVLGMSWLCGKANDSRGIQHRSTRQDIPARSDNNN